MFRRLVVVCVVALCGGMIVGCGGGQPAIEVVPVAGTVRLDGKPIEGVAVTMVPQNEGGKPGYAVSDGSGRFSLRSGPDLEGIPEGTYSVLFQKLTLPDGSPIPPDAMAADVDAVNQLPERYSNAAQSNLVAVVPASGAEDLSFDLSSRGRR